MLKAIIVDDEAPARSELRFLLDETGMVEVAAEAANVREAIEKLKEVGADIMFLDVNMPGVNGLQLAEALGKLKYPPYVIFVTAYSEHAVKAFEVNAVDYLVKPVETERLAQAINKVQNIIASQGRSTANERIPVEKGGKKLLVPASKIHYIMAKDDYSYLHTESDRYLSTVSLARVFPRAPSVPGQSVVCERGRSRERWHAAAHLERRGRADTRIASARRRIEEGTRHLGEKRRWILHFRPTSLKNAI